MKKAVYTAPEATKIEFCYDEHVVASGGQCFAGTDIRALSGSCEQYDIYDNVSSLT